MSHTGQGFLAPGPGFPQVFVPKMDILSTSTMNPLEVDKQVRAQI